MTTLEDTELLRRYASDKSEAAFAELVRRYLSPVYSFALRRLGGDTHLAEDVVQVAFTALARKAPALTDVQVLGGWLCRAAHFAARDVVRAESRRRSRYQELHLMKASFGPDESIDWEKVAPVLTESMGKLNDGDRDAIWLRFFEEKPYVEIGARLQISENGARMRVERALEKLQGLLAQRGVTSTAAALSAALAHQAVIAAPAGLAASITGVALSAAASGASTLAGWTIFMSTSKWLGGLAVGIVIGGLGTAYLATSQAREAQASLAALTSRVAIVDSRLPALEQRVAAEAQRVNRAEAENARLLKEVGRQKAALSAAPPLPTPVTSDVVEARMQRGAELAKNGDYAAALAEFLWCFDIGYKETRMGPVRLSFGVGEIARLAQLYPPAREALVERREKARRAMLDDAGDHDALGEFAALTRELKEGASIIPLLESLSAGDPRRGQLAGAARDALLETRRYGLAAEALSYGQLSSLFEMISRSRPWDRDFLVKKTAADIEILAGAGRLEEARNLVQRLTALDSSEAARALLQRHLERAGQTALLPIPAK